MRSATVFKPPAHELHGTAIVQKQQQQQRQQQRQQQQQQQQPTLMLSAYLKPSVDIKRYVHDQR